MTDFVHLHVHSDYSLLDSTAPIEDLVNKAAALGMKRLAITDHGNMFGVLKFQRECEKRGIHPIIGSEFYIAPDSRLNREYSPEDVKYYHLILLAASDEGYRNLMKLSSLANTEGFYMKPRIDKEVLEKYHTGLIGLSACIAGEIPALILAGKTQEAEAAARWFNNLFGQDNFYLEIEDHGIANQQRVNPVIAGISRKTGIPLVAANDIHYLERDDAPAHDTLLCIRTKSKQDDVKRERFEGSEFYFKSGDEMAALFTEYPEAIANTVRIAERCTAVIPQPGPLLPDVETFTTKTAIKELAIVLNISPDESNRIVNLIPERSYPMTLTTAFEQEPKLREFEQNPKYRELFTLARKLENEPFRTIP
ncbi:hypothetical protein AGMMS49991_06710 [Spirochaetia bacterium]|nr:hypothetical protein AGMMS49991_06710 [Spirochaetia bacterium]